MNKHLIRSIHVVFSLLIIFAFSPISFSQDMTITDDDGWKVMRYVNPENEVRSVAMFMQSENEITLPSDEFSHKAIFSVQHSSVIGRSITIKIIALEPFCLRDTCMVGVVFDENQERTFTAYKRYNDPAGWSYLEIKSDGEIEPLIRESKVMRINAKYQEVGQVEFVFNVMNFDVNKYLNQ